MSEAKERKKEARSDEERLMDHEYDGIREYDNPLPRWWVHIFWGSVIFAGGYFLHYHAGGKGESVLVAYEKDMARAGKPVPKSPAASEEALARLTTDSKELANGKTVYSNRCMPCHGDRGQGMVGPNLTDDAWINGNGTLVEIHSVVSNGVPEKGMPAWSKQLSDQEITSVVAFIGSLRGSKVPGKPPEGKEVKRQ